MIERKQFNGGIDADTVVDFIQPGDYLNAQNCRAFRDESGNGLAIKPVNGTSGKVSPENIQPMRVIGSITDEVKGRIYYFMFHGAANPDHTIFAWDRKSNTLYKVLRHAQVNGGLNFSAQYPITGVQLIGDDLYWTDNNNPPRKVNVERGIKTNHPAYVSQDGTVSEPYNINPYMLAHDITVIRRPAMLPLTINKIIVGDSTINWIKNNYFQFATRYKYRDNQYSVLSHYSKVAPHNKEDEEFNVIELTVPKAEKIDNEIQAVEFLVRRGEFSPWYIIKVYDRETDEALFTAHNDPVGAALKFNFTNVSPGVIVPDSESYLLFHDVPLKSNALEIAQNRLFLGNNVKGYDWSSTSINVSIKTAILDSLGEFYQIDWECDGTPNITFVLKVDGALAGTQAGWYYAFQGQVSTPSVPNVYVIKPNDFIGTFAQYPTVNDLLAVIGAECGSSSINLVTMIGTTTVLSDVPGFKSGTNYRIGLVFYDIYDRTSGVVHSPADISIPNIVLDSLLNAGFSWTLPSGAQPNVIPSWAVKYAIVRTKNLTMNWFTEYVATSLKYGRKDPDGTYSVLSDSYTNPDAILIPLDLLLKYGIGYTYSEGDVVRVSQGTIVHELQVFGAQGNYIVVSPKNIGTFGTNNARMIEIYRPNPTPDEEFYYEVGDVYLVNNPGQSTRSYGTTTGVIRGDVYKVNRNELSIAPVIETMNPNDKFWEIWAQDVGRPRQELFTKQTRYETEIAWSGSYLVGTEVNDLNAMLSGDIKTLDASVGGIQRLIFTSRTAEYGTVMLAIGNTDAASMYLGRSELYNAQEGANVISTANVIGSINVLRGGFGTLNPESVVENDGDVYWFSAIKAAVVRYNRNGLVPISDYKFGSVIKWLANKILLQNKATDNYYVIGGFDDFNKEYLLTTPTDVASRFPATYPVLSEMDEEITVNNPSVGTFTASLEQGEIYRMEIVKTPPTAIASVNFTDFYHGAVTGTGNGFQFVAAANGNNTFTTFVFGGTVTLKIYKQRINPYVVNSKIPQTFAFCEATNRWTSTYRFVPDWFGKIGDVLVSFKNGVLYTHDDETNVSYFHQTFYKSWFTFVANQPPNNVKRYQGLSVEADRTPDYIHLRTEYPNIQSTDLVSSELSVLEGVPYGAFLKDGLSPNAPGSRLNKQLVGDDMVGRYGKILIEYNKLVNFAVRLVNVIYKVSAGHKV